MKETKLFYVAIGIILLFGVGYTIAKNKVATPATKIRVSGNFKENIVFNSIIDVAEENGYFKRNNIEVEKVDTVAGTQLLGSHEIDASFLAASSTASLFLNNKDTKVIATLNNYVPAFHVVSRLSEEKIKDTKKIGVNQIGNADHLSAVLIAEKMGIKSPEYVLAKDDKVKIALLEKGEIDFAIIISQSALEIIKEKGGYTIIKPEVAFKDIALPLALNSTETAINEKPKAMEGFVKAIYSSITYNDNNKDKMITFFKEKYKVSDESARYIYERNEYSRKNFSFVPTTEAYKETVEMIGKFIKVTNPSRNVAEFVYPSLAEKAVK